MCINEFHILHKYISPAVWPLVKQKLSLTKELEFLPSLPLVICL